MAEKTREIVRTIKSISAKDESTAGQAIGAINEKERDALLETLKRIDKASLKKAISDKKAQEVSDKAAEEGRFLGKLAEEILAIHHEAISIKTRFYSCKELLLSDVKTDEAALIEQFKGLQHFIRDLSILMCLANKKQGEIVSTLKELGLSNEGVAKKLDISTKFAERLFTFHRFADKFPLLCYSGYSFETILKYKVAIERQAKEDVNFCSRLELEVTVEFEEDKEDELLSDG